AERLGVSARTLRRDVDRLRELGYPVQASRGTAGGYQLRPGAAVPPLLLDDDEAVAVVVGLRSAVAGSVAGIEEPAVRALAKIIQVIPRRLRHRADALSSYSVPVPIAGPPVDAGVLTTIALAARADEQLRFDYTDREGVPTRRRVEPNRLVSLGGRWYLLGFDVDRAAWRTYRVDRISAPTATGMRFRPREVPGGDAAAFVRDSVRSAPPRGARYDVEALIQAPASRVRRAVGRWGLVEPVHRPVPAQNAEDPHPAAGARAEAPAVGPANSDGLGDPDGPGGDGGADEACRLRMSVDDLGWPAQVLGSVGAPFTVVRPPELVDYMRGLARLYTAAVSPAEITGSAPTGREQGP
ncbi:MAG: WYL domain-containing protein, partial [Frankia sp.]|nr:WYL domain-containing protein [Frankia sp.]